jgi:hypothetical protein
VFDNSSVVFHGSLISDNNGRDGIGIFGGSSAASYGEVTIQANNNAGHGINVFGNAIVGMGRSGGMMTLHNNKRHGVSLFAAASMFTDRGTINPENNAGHGVFVGGNSNLANFGATFLMKGNKEAGLAVYDGSSVIMNKSTITDNGKDVTLSFGARATLKGNTIGTTTCDKSSLIRGDTACPE